MQSPKHGVLSKAVGTTRDHILVCTYRPDRQGCSAAVAQNFSYHITEKQATMGHRTGAAIY